MTRLSCGLLCSMLLSSAWADDEPKPAWLPLVEAVKPGGHPPLPAGTLSFEISWKGILRSGEVAMQFGKPGAHKPATTVIRTQAVSRGLAAAIFPYKGHSWTEIDPASFRPRLFTAFERDKEGTIRTRSRFFDTHVECRETTREHGKRTSTVETTRFDHAPLFSIGSAILQIRSQPLRDGDEIHLLMHPFNHPYLLKARVLGRENHLDRKSIRLSLEMHKIHRNTLELKPYRKLKKPAILWLSDDRDRLPMELRAKIFIGDIRATLAQFEKS